MQIHMIFEMDSWLVKYLGIENEPEYRADYELLGGLSMTKKTGGGYIELCKCGVLKFGHDVAVKLLT